MRKSNKSVRCIKPKEAIQVAEITDIRIYKLKIVGPQKAFAAITLDGEFAVHGIKVMERDDGTLWVSFPARRDASGEFRDIFHPITKEAREKIVSAVLEAYKKETQLKQTVL